FLTPAQVKEILMATARTDEFTGPISAPGDVRWGMGKVDAYEAVMLALATEGLNITNAASSEIDIYPNPAESVIFIRTSSDIQMKTVRFFGMNGQRFELPVVSGTIDVGSLAAGVYILQIESTGKIVRRRIVIMN
ncbi:MAG: T9SS type A sorting domain-containing protein, partial [Flavobacteriales bacterium]